MFSEDTLEKEVRPAIYGRGRMIVQHGASVQGRSCTYKGAHTYLSAKFDSVSSHEDHYDTSLVIDEDADRIVSFSCTCPASRKFAGPCKHVVALGLDFIRNEASYEGYNPLRHVSTTPIMSEYLDRIQRSERLQPLSAQAEPTGAVGLALMLSASQGTMFARFRVEGSRGGYAIKNIGDFVGLVRDGSYFSYGKKLAFAHDEAAFDSASWQVVQFLVRCVLNRRAYASERLYGKYFTSYNSASGASTGRELRLSYPEIDELIGLYKGRELQFDVEGAEGAISGRPSRLDGATRFVVVDGDPNVSVSVAPTHSDDAYEIIRAANDLYFFTSLERVYALQGGKLYRCSPRLFAVRDFMQSVYCNPKDHILLSKEDAPRFAAMVLPTLEKNLKVKAPAALEDMRPVPCTFEFYLDRQGAAVTADAIACYGDKRYHLGLKRDEREHDLTRDIASELAVRRLVGHYFAQVTQSSGQQGGQSPSAEGKAGAWILPTRDSDAVARLLFGGIAKMRAMGTVYSTPAFDRLVTSAHPHVHATASITANLIQLRMAADDLPEGELYALLSSYRHKKGYHRLRDGSFLDISQLNLDEVSRLTDELGLTARQLSSGVAELPSYKAFLLDDMLENKEKDASFNSWIDNFKHIDPRIYKAPPHLALPLRPYQLQGFQWLCALADMGFGGILADEMGLGKTAQLIAFLLARRGNGQSLIVCPASLVYNWEAEFTKFAPEMDVVVVAGSAARRRSLMREGGHDVLISSYDLVRRDIDAYVAKDFFAVVLDEAQYVKNYETLSARAVKALRARHRFALTGTPVENRLSELWSIFDFLMPGLLGTYESFRVRYEQPISEGDEEVAGHLKAAVGPFILRRLKREVLTDLPDKLEQIVVAQMGAEQRKLYRAHEQALRLSLAKQDDESFSGGKLQILAELTRLRQLCCDPRLVYEDYRGASCKLEAIDELVSTSLDAGSKLLIFSQFTSFLALIAQRLKKGQVAFYELTGSTPKQQRLQLVNAFNADDTPVFLISLKAGGTGLNLVGAQVVIHADPWWNVAAENQATDRAHRIGQKNDVTVYKVICKDTIEERMLALQDAKAKLADQVIGEGQGMSLGSLSKNDLLDLLG